MTDPRLAFYRAVEAAPDDDTPRLVFADWLDEHGDPDLAAAVRAACAEPNKPVAPVVRERFRGLYKFSKGVQFDRGLPDRINLPADVFVRDYPAVAALGPAHHVKLSHVKGHERALAGCAHLQCVRWLSLDFNKMSGRQTAEVFRSRHLTQVTRLVLNNNPFGNAGAAAVAAADMPALARLTATSNKLKDAGLTALFGSKTLGRVTHWELGGNRSNQFTADGYAAMAQAVRFADVQALDLNHCGELAAAAEAIAGSPHAAGLRELKLDWMEDAARGLSALAASPHLGGLTRLDVNWASGDPGAAGVAALFGSDSLAGLTALSVYELPAGREGLAAATAGRGLPALTTLCVRSGDIRVDAADADHRPADEAAFRAFVRSPRVARLTGLDLANCHLGATGAELLARSPAAARLESLNLNGTGLTDAAVEALAGSPFLTGLRELHLSVNPDLTGKAAAAVIGSPIFRDLRRLSLPTHHMSPADWSALKARFGPGLVAYYPDVEAADADGE